ncbi:hypothetical protein LTR62_002135 [Meristemomyces frigidus]|uniref:Uncharacterized protein n=1 Tax=Meristemomyces frigidus TaxID=1508187 RepID=A0AAN7YAX8_9PEZI|nr:hypothetical protein LTR62_002135 [Meristemomyces frigidus]
MSYLLIRSHNPTAPHPHHPLENADDSEHEHMSGHALMATAPPHSHILHHHALPEQEKSYPHQMPAGMSTDGLMKLLDLSHRLPFASYSEITPVMAWGSVLRHPRFAELSGEDFAAVKRELGAKVRCYGFGAVLEDFELNDALEAVLARKREGRDAAFPMVGQMRGTQQQQQVAAC